MQGVCGAILCKMFQNLSSVQCEISSCSEAWGKLKVRHYTLTLFVVVKAAVLA